MASFLKIFLSFLLFIISTSVFAEKKNYFFNFSSGFFYGRGQNTSNNETKLSSIPVAIRVSRGLSSIELATNYSKFITDEKNTENSFEGKGNIYLSGKHFVRLSRVVRYLSFESKIKFPSAKSSSILISKGVDIKVSSSAYFNHSKNWLVSTIAYKWRQKNFNHTFSFSTNYSRILLSRLSAGISINYEQPIQLNGKEILESMFHINWKSSSTVKTTLYYIHGYKDPRILWASGLQMSFTW